MMTTMQTNSECWAIQTLFDGNFAVVTTSISTALWKAMEAKELRRGNLTNMTGIPLTVVDEAIYQGLGTAETLSALSALLGLGVRDLLPAIVCEGDKKEAIRQKMYKLEAGLLCACPDGSSARKPLDEDAELTFFLCLRLIDEIEQLYLDSKSRPTA